MVWNRFFLLRILAPHIEYEKEKKKKKHSLLFPPPLSTETRRRKWIEATLVSERQPLAIEKTPNEPVTFPRRFRTSLDDEQKKSTSRNPLRHFFHPDQKMSSSILLVL